ncbi:Mth938-like domain-containing protein [Candidatus Igneacidithiobacillus taiwanensis]|uniref:Mth938-like domain-containing protein n=1 Tax=Candidatus Igneacidithiobacillus taiwanensis TaxID=1945924 RepID=UPI00289A5BDC|nr:Mth938-like domain-containing protein [Candidatus Igneacidithiobacillus taiwanensis]MCE5360757.1 Mth938-like domain-containing protein [Acidithiobacillus sp.]
MKLHRQSPGAQHSLQSYDATGFVIDGLRYTGGVLLSRTLLLHPWGPAAGGSLGMADFAALLATPPEVLLVGTGARQQLDIALLGALRQAGLAAEIMDSAAACRTYGILLAEDREVAAALLPLAQQV